MAKKFLLSLIATIVFAVILTAGFVLAWTEPMTAPPGGNVAVPLNTSINAQAKEGALVIGANSGVTTGLIVQYGNVGIGTTNPSATACGGGQCRLDIDGRVRGEAFYYASDITLKENIGPLKNSLDKVLQLEGVSFNWKEDNRPSIGLISQEVEEIFPEIVSTDEQGIQTLEYSKLIAPLIEATKEQQKEIEALKAEIELLKQR